MILKFTGQIWYWRGPAPHYFVTVPTSEAEQIKQIAHTSTYGWGMIPADVRIGETEWYTALWPKEGSYIVPIRAAVRKAERLDEGDKVRISLKVRLRYNT